jgi:hypothetical protein
MPSRVRSTKKKSERTSAFEVRIFLWIGVPKAHSSGIYARLCKDSLRELLRKRWIATFGNIEHFELRSDADALHVSSTAEGAMLLRGRLCLHQEALRFDRLYVRLFPSEISFEVVAGHAEQSGQKQHENVT